MGSLARRAGLRYNSEVATSALFMMRTMDMEQVVQFSEREEAKALPVLLRHSPGVALPNRVYLLSREAVQALHDAGIAYRELSRTGFDPAGEGVASGERI